MKMIPLLLILSSFSFPMFSSLVITSSSSTKLSCGRNEKSQKVLGTPEWTIDPSCLEIRTLEWKDWSPNNSVIVHSGKVYPTQVSEIIIPGQPIQIDSNRMTDEPQLLSFTPASVAIITACFHAKWGRDFEISCDESRKINMNEVSQEEICLYSENLNLAGLFQHYYINTVPIRGLAIEIKNRFYPNATLVAHHTHNFYHEGLIRHYDQVPCVVTLFVTPYYRHSHTLLSPPPTHTTWDCYWYGAFDYLRHTPLPQRWTASEPTSRTSTDTLPIPNLFVYVDREKRTIQSPENHELRLALQKIASETTLEFYFLGSNSTAAQKAKIFSEARIVVAVHGGALANMIFMNPNLDTNVAIIEIQPISGERRFCFLCMAYGLKIPHYGVYFEEQWDQGYAADRFPVNVTTVTTWIRGYLKSTKFIEEGGGGRP
jgi:hypothetical protein